MCWFVSFSLFQLLSLIRLVSATLSNSPRSRSRSLSHLSACWFRSASRFSTYEIFNSWLISRLHLVYLRIFQTGVYKINCIPGSPWKVNSGSNLGALLISIYSNGAFSVLSLWFFIRFGFIRQKVIFLLFLFLAEDLLDSLRSELFKKDPARRSHFHLHAF